MFDGRGDAYRGKGDYDRAIADYDRAIADEPKDVFAHNGRGAAYDAKGDHGRAAVDYDETIGFVNEVIEQADDAMKRDPRFAEAYIVRGRAYAGKGEHDRAIADFNEAIRLDPKSGEAYASRGVAYGGKRDYRRAIADYDQALTLYPGLAEARRNRERAQAALAATPAPPAPVVQAASSPAAPSRRIALVIGMSAYANVAPLRNPASDARAVADAFRRLGFAEVVEREDLTRVQMEDALKDFGDKAADADWAVIYYAGHGVELNGDNYLVPVDAKLARVDHVEDETVTLRRVLSKAAPARQLRMVILDACRNNPFRMASADGRRAVTSRGLSAVVPARGVLVAYAARDGTTADDGDGEHSPFTAALLSHLETPGLDIRIMFGKVHDTVLARTKDGQEPYTYGALPGQEFYFKQAAR
jgi:tetratricopeptide (TPR) repeat protein